MRRPRICLRSSFRACSRSDSVFASLRKDRKPLGPCTSFERVDDGSALVEHRFLRVFGGPLWKSAGEDAVDLFNLMDGNN